MYQQENQIISSIISTYNAGTLGACSQTPIPQNGFPSITINSSSPASATITLEFTSGSTHSMIGTVSYFWSADNADIIFTNGQAVSGTFAAMANTSYASRSIIFYRYASFSCVYNGQTINFEKYTSTSKTVTQDGQTGSCSSISNINHSNLSAGRLQAVTMPASGGSASINSAAAATSSGTITLSLANNTTQNVTATLKKYSWKITGTGGWLSFVGTPTTATCSVSADSREAIIGAARSVVVYRTAIYEYTYCNNTYIFEKPASVIV